MNRFGAFAIHLGISLVIFAVLAAIVVYVWYPGFFFTTDGGWQGIRIIAMVDLVLGPLLTLVVFDRSKPELRRDLSIIGIVQVSCLIAGTYVVYSERPVALVYVDGHFYSMSADDYANAGVDAPDLADIPGPYPKRVVVELPNDLTEQSEVRRAAYTQGKPLRLQTDLYRPMSYELLQASREAVPGQVLLDADAPLVEAWLAEHGGDLTDYVFFPFGARYGYVHLAVSTVSQQIVGPINVIRQVGG